MITMFNSKDLIMDKDLTFLSYGQPINAVFTVDEIINGDLWEVSAVNTNVYKAIPLFNCDQIISSNADDIILETNKCLIFHADDDTNITCVSEDTGSIHFYSLQLYAFAPYTTLDVPELSVYCIVYDEFLNTLNNIVINVLIDGDVVTQIQTDNQGIAKYTVSEACEISFEFEENISNVVSINDGGE